MGTKIFFYCLDFNWMDFDFLGRTQGQVPNVPTLYYFQGSPKLELVVIKIKIGDRWAED